MPFKTLLYCLPRKYTIPIWHQHQHRINVYRTLPLLSLQTILLSPVSNGQVPCSIISKTKGILKKAAHVSSLVTYRLCSHWLHFCTLYFLASAGSFAPLVIKYCTAIALIPSLPRLAFNVLSFAFILASHWKMPRFYPNFGLSCLIVRVRAFSLWQQKSLECSLLLAGASNTSLAHSS